jgi:hypothetical protein
VEIGVMNLEIFQAVELQAEKGDGSIFRPIKPIEINEWSGIRIKKLGSKGLVLVSDYSTYEPEETIVRFSSKELSEKTLIDAETAEKVEPVLGIYNVKIKAERARLFHFVTE